MDLYKRAQNRVKALSYNLKKKLGIKLDDIVVKEFPESVKKDKDFCSSCAMYTEMHNPDSIFMNTEGYNNYLKSGTIDDVNLAYYRVEPDLAHELAHLAHRKMLLPEDYLGIATDSFTEGLAEFVSLHCMFDSKYDFWTRDHFINPRIRYYESSTDFDDPYVQGYHFFKKVLGAIGEDKLLEVARAPPFDAREVRYPILYLLRNYPAQALKSIPKLATGHIKSTLKRMKRPK